MTIEEYFGDWLKVISKNELLKVTKAVTNQYKLHKCSPDYKNIFKVFNVTPYNKLNTVMLLQDPYPNNKATGIALGNKDDIDVSPSLEIIREAAIDYTIPHFGIEFDITLENWCKQGILMLNTALSVEYGKPGSHSVLWNDFTINLVKNLNRSNPGLIWVLWGNSAKALKHYITNGYIIEEYHPSYYARTKTKLNPNFFRKLKQLIKYHYDINIEWFKEFN